MRSKAIFAMLSALTAFALIACGTTQEPTSAPADQMGAGDRTCFMQLSDEDEESLRQYAAQNGDGTKERGSTDDGTQDVCVIQQTASGEYEERHYSSERDDDDNEFSEYLLYSMLLGDSRTVATIGLIEGDLSVTDYMLLRYLVGMDNDGRTYPVYGCDSGHRCQRHSTKLYNQQVKVTHVRYGKAQRIDLKTARSQKPPAGYGIVTLKPVTTKSAKRDAAIKVQRGGLGVPSAGQRPGSQVRVPGQTAAATPAPRVTGGSTPTKVEVTIKERPRATVKAPPKPTK